MEPLSLFPFFVDKHALQKYGTKLSLSIKGVFSTVTEDVMSSRFDRETKIKLLDILSGAVDVIARLEAAWTDCSEALIE
jgi:Flp pilus assembly pilin Flp